MNFTWYCFNAMEPIPESFIKMYPEVPNYKVAVLNPLKYDPNVVKKGGCYGDGNYFFNTPCKSDYFVKEKGLKGHFKERVENNSSLNNDNFLAIKRFSMQAFLSFYQLTLQTFLEISFSFNHYILLI